MRFRFSLHWRLGVYRLLGLGVCLRLFRNRSRGGSLLSGLCLGVGLYLFGFGRFLRLCRLGRAFTFGFLCFLRLAGCLRLRTGSGFLCRNQLRRRMAFIVLLRCRGRGAGRLRLVALLYVAGRLSLLGLLIASRLVATGCSFCRALAFAQGTVILGIVATGCLGPLAVTAAFGVVLLLGLLVAWLVAAVALVALVVIAAFIVTTVVTVVAATVVVAVTTVVVTAATFVAIVVLVVAGAVCGTVVRLAVIVLAIATVLVVLAFVARIAIITVATLATALASILLVSVVVTVAVFAAATAAGVLLARVTLALGLGFLDLGRLGLAGKDLRQPGEEAGQDTQIFFCGSRRCRGRLRRWRGGIRRHQFDRRLLGLDFRILGGSDIRILVSFQQLHLMAWLGGGLVIANPFHLEMRGFQILVGDDDHTHVMRIFNGAQGFAFFVQQVGGHGHRYLGLDLAGALLHDLFFDQAKDAQRQGFHVTDMALSVTARADNAGGFTQARPQPLSGQLKQAKARDATQLDTGPVSLQGIAHAVFHIALIACRPHVDEVHHDQAADITQAQLAGDFIRRFQVGVQGGFLNVRALGGPGGVDIDGYQRFGGIDDNGTTGRQFHFTLEGGLDLGFDLEAGKERGLIAVQLDLVLEVLHDLLHEALGLVVDFFGVDQDFANVLAQIIANGADDDVGFLVDQEGRLAFPGGIINGIPQLQQVVQVPLQFFGATAQPCGANNDPHFIGDGQRAQGFLELLAFLTLNATGNTAGPGVVGHQYQIAAGQADEGGEGGAFIAALFFGHLDNDFLAFLDDFLDVDATLDIFRVFLEVLAGNFLEREKTVAFSAEVHEGGFQGGFYPGDLAFVDVGLFLFAGSVFDIQVIQPLAVDQCHPNLFRVSGVNKHTFHGATTRLWWHEAGPECNR